MNRNIHLPNMWVELRAMLNCCKAKKEKIIKKMYNMKLIYNIQFTIIFYFLF